MEPPYSSVPHHHYHHSRSRRHHTREQSGREVPRKRHHGPSRPSLPSEADGNKENLIQGWLDDLEARSQGAVHGTAGHTHPAETPDYEKHPHPSHHPPSLCTGNVTSKSRPGQDRPKHKRGKRDRSALEDGLVAAPEIGRNRETGFDPNRRPQQIAEVRLSERDGSINLSSSGYFHEDLGFQKKSRRKTRTDRYDVIKNDDAAGETSRKGSKKSKKTKDTLTSAREVMEKFSSASILNERITMQPSVGPGLFDNGRQSKAQPMSDLTFHHMDFLRQPRREPQQPLSLKREADKKRSDREREEISAFFLQTSVPYNLDTRDRSKPSGDGATFATPSHIFSRRRPSSQPALVVGNHHHPATTQEKGRNNGREGSKATTYLSWTTSCESPTSRPRLASEGPDEQSSPRMRSPTPLNVREALAETGIFNNTGVRQMTPGSEDDKTWPRCEPIVSKQPENSPRLQSSQKCQNKPIRIIRYQDRGTMVNKEDTPQDKPNKHAQQSRVRDPPVTAPDRIQETSETPTTVLIPSSVAFASETPIQLISRTKDTHDFSGSKEATNKPTAVSEKGEERDVRPERPVSPKLSVVERLEAAVNTRWQNSMDHEMIQDPGQSGWYLGDLGGSLEPIPLSKQVTCRWPAPNVKLRMIRDREMPLTTTSYFASTESIGPLVSDTPVPEVADDTADLVQLYEPPNHWAAQVPPLLVSNQNTTHAVQDGQSMREYITQLGRNVLDIPREGVAFEPAPLAAADSVDVRYGLEPGRHQIQAQAGTLDIQPPSLMSATSVQPNPSETSRLGWLRDWNLEDTEEKELRFISSFWRPNRYPI